MIKILLALILTMGQAQAFLFFKTKLSNGSTLQANTIGYTLDRNGTSLSTTNGQVSISLSTNGSLTFSNRKLQLSGDSNSPGNSYYYGTNGSGTKGYHTFPSSGATNINGLSDAISNVYNVYLGNGAGAVDSGASFGTGIGIHALANNTSASGLDNTAVGYYALNGNTTADYNTGVGFESLFMNSTGSRNTAEGYLSSYSNTTGARNTAIGYSALMTNSVSDYNTAVGHQALTNATGFSNTALGTNAGNAVTTANGNVLLGYQAGDAITSGAKNIVIGYDVDAQSNTASNQMNIGDTIFANGMNLTTGKLGIRKKYPTVTLDVNGAIAGTNLSGTNTGDQTITLTGDVTGSGTGSFAATVVSQTSANWATKISDEVGTGRLVFNGSPTFTSPTLGAATATTINSTSIPSSKTLVVTTDGLEVHAATTSASLAGVISDEVGTGRLVFNGSTTLASPTFITPALGTPASGVLTNATGLPISTGVSGLGSNVATFLATATSANFASAVSDETGTGKLVFNGSPAFLTPSLGAATGTSLVTTGKIVSSSNVNGTTINATKLLASGSVNGSTANMAKVLSSGAVNGTKMVASNGMSMLTLINYNNGGGAVTLDPKRGNFIYLQLNGSTCAIKIAKPNGPTRAVIALRQFSATRLATWNADIAWPSATAPTLSTTSGYVDFVTCVHMGSTVLSNKWNCQASLDLR